MSCPHETARRFRQGPDHTLIPSIECARMFDALGWTVAGPLSICEACQSAGADKLPAEESEFGRARIATLIGARLQHGDMPEWQAANPIDIHALFTRYAGMVTREKLETCYDAMTLRWIATPETRNGKAYGHSEATARTKLKKIATDHKLTARYIEHASWLTREIAAGLLADMRAGGCTGCRGGAA